MASALMALMLTGCAASGGKPSLPPVPGDIKVCFDRLVPKPKAGALTKRDVFRIIADLKRSELEKSSCGKRLIAWYEAQAKVYGGAK